MVKICRRPEKEITANRIGNLVISEREKHLRKRGEKHMRKVWKGTLPHAFLSPKGLSEIGKGVGGLQVRGDVLMPTS